MGSTDTNVAAIGGTGKVTFLSDGSVSFKAYWVEKDPFETSKKYLQAVQMYRTAMRSSEN